MLRSFRITMVLVLMVLVVAGSALAAQRSVTFWFYGAPTDFDVLDRIRLDFEKENPDISVEVVNVPYSVNFEKWAVAVAGGAPPDASMANWGIIYQMSGALEPLDDWANRSENVHAENYFPAHWEGNWFQGRMMGLPFRANAQLILYDKDAFAEAGIGSTPATWDEFADVAHRLTRRTDDDVQRYGFSFRNAQHNRTVNQFGQSNGWEPFNPEYTEAYFTDDKLLTAIDFLNGMVVRGVAAAPGMPGVGNLAAGRVAMLNEGPWALSGIRENAPDRQVGAFVPPAGPSGEAPIANATGEILVMFRDAQDKEATWKWLEYLSYIRNADYNSMTGSFFPVVTYAAGQREWLESEIWAAVLDNYFNRLAPNVHTMPQLLTPCGIQFSAAVAYDQALAAIFSQNQDPWTTLDEVQRLAMADLASAELAICMGGR